MDEELDSRSSPAWVVIADDHPLYRDALRSLLGGQPDLELVGEAADGREALELCRRLRPDLVLMDLRMPGMDGLEATREIKRELPRTVVLVLTASEDPNHLSKALKAGAGGYVLKDASRQRMIEAIRGALDGESALDQKLAMRLLLRLIDEGPKEVGANPVSSENSFEGERERERTALKSLTLRETSVLRLLMRGRSNQEIAHSLLVSVSTIKKHVAHIIAKLGVSDRTQAAVRAIELGLRPEREG